MEAGGGSLWECTRTQLFDTEEITPSNVDQSHEAMVLLLLVAELGPGAESPEKRIAVASGGLAPAKRDS